MVIFGSIVGFVLFLISGGDLITQYQWSKSSNRKALWIIIPMFILGIYLMYLPFG